MDNTQNTTRYEDADRDTTPAAPSLAEMLAARAEQIAENERENARREQLSREQDRREAVEYAQRWIADALSPTLAEALRAIAACDDTRIGEDDDEYGDIALAALVLLDVTGASVDPEASPSDRDDGRWYIQRRYNGWRGAAWTLHGPHDYRAIVDDNGRDRCDARLLDALAAYPAWLAGAEQRRAEEERKARQKRRAEQAKPRLYDAIEPINAYLAEKSGMLATGNRLRVRVQDSGEENGLRYCDGKLSDHDSVWLLIVEDNGLQRLIPVDRVQDIMPLPDLDTDPDDAA